MNEGEGSSAERRRQRGSGQRSERATMIAVGGGKGGIGKSLLTANLGVCFARSGKRVVLVDADLGGANLHTCLGIDLPAASLSDFVQRRVANLEDVVVDSGIDGLGLISGAQDFLGSANIKYTQKLRTLRQIRRLQADVILLDLGSGTSFNVLDFFLSSHLGIVIIVPEPTSLENSYRFLRSAFYRLLHHRESARPFLEIIEQAMLPNNDKAIRTPHDIIRLVGRMDPERGDRYRAWLSSFRPLLVVNQVRSPEDAELGPAVLLACRKYLGIELDLLGHIDYGDNVWQAVRTRTVLMMQDVESPVTQRIWHVARQIEKRMESLEVAGRERLKL